METSTSGAKRQTQAGLSAPSISLPKGGGAIRGIGEKFSANPVTGTGSMSVPLPINPGLTLRPEHYPFWSQGRLNSIKGNTLDDAWIAIAWSSAT
jgi:hypothetical protein